MEGFYFNSNNIIETINDDFVLLRYHNVNILYCVRLQMVNVNHLCKQFDVKFRFWKKCQQVKQLMDRFPDKFVNNYNDSYNKGRGTYISEDLVNIILCLLNPILGYTITNNYHDGVELINKTGFVYIVQPEEYIGTNIYKIGRTWNPSQRFVEYGKKVKIIRLNKVKDMYLTEINLINDITEYNKPFKGKEYFAFDNLDDLLYYYNENVKNNLVKEE